METAVKVLQQTLTMMLIEEQDEEEWGVLFPLMDLFFKGNIHRHPKDRVRFMEWYNDVINKEKEEEHRAYYIKWFKFKEGYPDSDEEEEENKRIMAAFFGDQQNA